MLKSVNESSPVLLGRVYLEHVGGAGREIERKTPCILSMSFYTFIDVFLSPSRVKPVRSWCETTYFNIMNSINWS